MDIKELKDKLNEDDIKVIMNSLGGEIHSETNNQILYNTICHGGDSPNKLVYYKDTKSFFCYTNCGVIDIFTIVCEVKNLSIPESIVYICKLLGINTRMKGFGESNNVINDWSFINSYYKKENKVKKEVLKYDENILNIFQDIYTTDWIDDGISEEVQKAYNIKYSTLQQKIIIPHYDVEGNLIGIRGRALIEEEAELYGKYSPFQIHKTIYNHPLGQNLYGIHINKDTIKRVKKCMLVESEKGTLQMATAFGIDNNFTLALCGSARVSEAQIQLLLDLEVNEVIIGLDRQYEVVGDEKYKKWLNHIRDKIINPLLPYFKVYVIWDTEDILKYKESPTDTSVENLLKLMKNKIYISD